MADAQAVAAERITDKQFLEQADGDTHAERVNGETIPMSPESNEHQEVTLFSLTEIGPYAQRKRLGVMRTERFQMTIGPGLLGRGPDLLFLKTEHLDRLKDTQLDGRTDLAVEITSPESKYPVFRRG